MYPLQIIVKIPLKMRDSNLCQVAKYCSIICKENDKARHTDAECHPARIMKKCSSCRKTSSSLQTCSGCYRAFYCDKKCQLNHRNEHKVDCKNSTDKIRLLAGKLDNYFFANEARYLSIHYYWGNMPAYDYLNLSENEGIYYASDLNVSVLGVGDLRNVVLTCSSLPETYSRNLLFVLNDCDECALARLVLLLFILIKVSSVFGQACFQANHDIY